VISLGELHREMSTSLRELNTQIQSIFDEARQMETDAFQLRTADGKLVLAPILTAKSRLLTSMLELRKMEQA
jgi:hypothetical protein